MFNIFRKRHPAPAAWSEPGEAALSPVAQEHLTAFQELTPPCNLTANQDTAVLRLLMWPTPPTLH